MNQPSRKKRERRNAGWFWLAALCILLPLHLWFPEFGTGALDDSYSSSASGKKAFYLLLDQESYHAERNRTPLSVLLQSLDYGDTLCILGPARYPSPLEWSALLAWVEEGGKLVISANPDHPQFKIEALEISVAYLDEVERDNIPIAQKEEDKDETGLSLVLESEHDLLETQATTVFPDAPSLVWDTNARVTSPSGQALITAGETQQAIRQTYGLGTIVVSASSEIFSNQSMVDGGSVPAYRLIEAAGHPDYLVVDESLNASGTSKVVALLIDPTFRPLTIQLLITLLIFGWWKSNRFGPILSSHILPRHNIVSHTDNVGNLHYKKGNGRALLFSYIKQLFSELNLRHFRGEEHRVLDPIARRLQEDPQQIKTFLKQAAQIAKTKKVNRHQMGDLIRKLSKIRQAALPGKYQKK
ncbi:hypothetical protein Enr10x_54730 [Gimesia panareensis]|uniref:DUF4350 domain-containing protein n=1 Tax=Gimesia panareensis TaxID=2527978 RepID=A0A517QEP1_9PLAN|nr:DUF4350 domain-containing protein [Gimesia panareensis]QDT30113.1 hypothetical protein Enr10x_54730 [Gimesia panareensis]